MTLKHIYEIAKLKSQDPSFENVELIRICRLVIGSAHSLGIEVVKGDLDPKEYHQFLEERKTCCSRTRQRTRREETSQTIKTLTDIL